MKYKVLCFDMDGTIMKTDVGIDEAHRYALKTLNLKHKLPDDQHHLYIGPSNEAFCRAVYKMEDQSLIDEYDRLFCEEYVRVGMQMSHPYQGIPELMRDAHAAGYRVYICTAKNEEAATQIAKDEGLYEYCDGIVGALSAADEKVDLLKRLLTEENIVPADAVMIGDRYTDLDAGRECGTKTIGVNYGYAPEDEIENCRPDFIADTVQDLREHLLGPEILEKQA